MDYRDSKVGFAIAIPEGWRLEQTARSEGFPRMVFFCSGKLRIVVAARAAEPGEERADDRAAALLRDLKSRQMPGEAIPALAAGDETNVAAIIYRADHETQRAFSVFRDGVVYHFTHTGDASGPAGPAVDRILASFRFPDAKAAADFLRALRPESWLEQATRNIARTETEKILRHFNVPFRNRKG
jgi:hypothetical protein